MKNKILIATGIFPPDIGGPATMLKALADSLVKAGFKIKIITYTQKQKNRRTEEQRNTYKVYYVNINSLFAKIIYFLKMFKLASWADVVYATDTYSVGRFAYYIKKLLNKKYILRFTGDSAWEIARTNNWTQDYILDFQNKKYNSKIEKLKKRRNKILFNADKIIVDSQFNKNLAEKIVGTRHCLVQDGKINVIYNAIDFKYDEVNENIVQQIKNKYPGKIIVTACRLTPWKGIDKIIKILPELKDKIGECNFLVLGEGSEKEKLKMKSEKHALSGVEGLKINNNVYFLGKIKQQEIINYFAAADVFVLNSQYEGLSHTLLEVMKTGTPIITTNCGGNPELITDGQEGLLVDYGNNQELLNALVKILSDRELADKLAENAKSKVKEFKWSSVVKKTIKVIKSD